MHYDPNRPFRIEGTVVSFEFRNPQSSLTIEARDEAGAAVLWTCEMASWGQLSRRGVTEESFQPGESIVVEGVAARRDPLGCECGASTHADGGDMVIQAEFMDSVRVVDMGANGHPPDVEPGTLGHSVGRWEGEVLIIETALFQSGVLLPNGMGILNSPELVFTERLSVNGEGDLIVDWTAEDPVHFTGPVTGQRIMARTTSPVGPYDCVPEFVD